MKFNFTVNTRITILIEACSVIAYMTLNLPQTIQGIYVQLSQTRFSPRDEEKNGYKGKEEQRVSRKIGHRGTEEKGE